MIQDSQWDCCIYEGFYAHVTASCSSHVPSSTFPVWCANRSPPRTQWQPHWLQAETMEWHLKKSTLLIGDLTYSNIQQNLGAAQTVILCIYQNLETTAWGCWLGSVFTRIRWKDSLRKIVKVAVN